MQEAIEPSVTEEVTEESTGLLDQATQDPEESSPENTQEMAIDHRDPQEAEEENALHTESEEEDEPLERPDWWPENFWNGEEEAPDLEGIAKSWMDLRKQISQGKHKAPADGNYDTSVFGETPEDDPLRSHVMDWAKDYGVSQSALDDLVGKVVEMGFTQQQEAEMNIKEEMKLLGPNAQARIDTTDKWLRGMHEKGVLSKEDLQEARYMGGTAHGLSIFEKLRSAYEGRIPVETTPVDGTPSEAELDQLVADPRYRTDPAYRQKVERAFAQRYPD